MHRTTEPSSHPSLNPCSYRHLISRRLASTRYRTSSSPSQVQKSSTWTRRSNSRRSYNDLYDEIQHLHTLGRTGLTQNPALQLRMNGKGCKRPIGIALSLLGYMLLFERTIPEFCVTYFPTRRTVAGVLVSHSGNRMN